MCCVRAVVCARSPTFIFKVPRPQHFAVLVANFPQVTVDKPLTCVFTPMEEFRQSVHTATPVLAVNFYNEFAASKDLVLVRATVMPKVRPPLWGGA